MARSKWDGWQSCPAGEFGRLSGRLAARRQRQSAAAVALGISAIVVAGIAAAAATQYVVDVMTLPDRRPHAPCACPCDPLPPLDPSGESRR